VPYSVVGEVKVGTFKNFILLAVVLCNSFAHVLFKCALEVDEDDILMLVALLGAGMGP